MPTVTTALVLVARARAHVCACVCGFFVFRLRLVVRGAVVGWGVRRCGGRPSMFCTLVSRRRKTSLPGRKVGSFPTNVVVRVKVKRIYYYCSSVSYTLGSKCVSYTIFCIIITLLCFLVLFQKPGAVFLLSAVSGFPGETIGLPSVFAGYGLGSSSQRREGGSRRRSSCSVPLGLPWYCCLYMPRRYLRSISAACYIVRNRLARMFS